MLGRVAEGVKVESLANGNMLIQIRYKESPVEPDATPVGLGTRLAIAEEIEAVLSERMRAKP